VAASLPAIVASFLSGATSALGTLSEARKRALRDASPPATAQALDRYLDYGPIIETRWMVLRVIGISSSTLLWFLTLRTFCFSTTALLAAVVGTLVAFGVPAEVIRALASHSAEKSAPLFLRALRPLEWIIVPIASPLTSIRKAVSRALPNEMSQPPDLTGDEMGIIVEEGEKSGHFAHDEAELIKNVLEFGDHTVGEMMVPRTHVDALEIDTPLAAVLERIRRDEHSRFPVYAERIDNVVGVLHVKDLISLVEKDKFPPSTGIEPLLRRPALYVSDGQSAISVLHEMRQRRQHLAIVIDEFGSMNGIITFEDLIERIVGDIRDEHDEDAPSIVELNDGRLSVDAALSIVDLNRRLNADLPEDESYNSLGGLLVARMGRVPPVGARLVESGHEFIVRQADERHVSRVEIVERPPPASANPRPSRPSNDD
jgi:putative hemolysin